MMIRINNATKRVIDKEAAALSAAGRSANTGGLTHVIQREVNRDAVGFSLSPLDSRGVTLQDPHHPHGLDRPGGVD